MRLLVVALALWSLGCMVRAAEQLEWDPSPDSSVVGYVLYHRVAGTSYLAATDIGNQTNVTLTNLISGITNVFYVTAYDSDRVEGDPSILVATNLPGAYPGPTISPIADQSMVSQSSIGPLPFTIGDALFSPTNLRLSAVSSNPALVPNANILFGGSDSNRTLTVVPALNESGSAIITMTVDDGIANMVASFLLTVDPAVPAGFSYFLFEGESGMLLDPMEVFDDTDASGGHFTATSRTDLGSVTFPLNIPRSGAYVIWWRTQAFVSYATPFIVVVDEGAADVFHSTGLKSTNGWRWVSVGGSSEFTVSDGDGSPGRRTVVPLTAGPHKLSVWGLDPNMLLDQMVITDDRSFVPAPPVLNAPVDQSIDELATLVVTNTATAANPSATQLTFSLISAPAGVTLDPVTGVLTWTPTEVQGPSTNRIGVQVADNGTPPLSDIRTITLIVNEVNNSAPVLSLPSDQTIDELLTFVAASSFTDLDLPASTPTFTLLSAPEGMLINPNTGVIFWTPAETQSPSTNLITVQVTDNGSPSLSDTGSFTLVVTEVNDPPVLTVPTNQTINELSTWVVTITAADADVPTNILAFSLLVAPPGATLDSSSGVLRWTPTEAQGPSTNTITVKVTDNGIPALSDTNSFMVVVNEVNAAPVLTMPVKQTIAELTALSVNATATDPDVPTNTLTFSLLVAPAGATLDASTGALRWTPTEAQGPSTNTITIKVTDNGIPALSDTNSFTVVVNEVNAAPVLTMPVKQTIAELTALSVNATATDPDVPANTLTFSLVSGPAGLAISSNGAITWTPSEAQGPSTNLVTVRVFDNGSPSLGATNSFQVIVAEANNAPILPAVANASINELTTLTITNTATDVDLPANTLSYQLLEGPANATISAGGVVTWTPTEAQGPGTNVFTTKVTDNGTPALSATNSFTVVVNEVNRAPVLAVPPNKAIHGLATLVITNVVSDPDLPANTLTFALVSAPAGMILDSATGVLTWTPTEAQQSSTNLVTVQVIDDGSPPLGDTASFTVAVNEENSPPLLVVPAAQTINEGMTLIVTNSVIDPDVPADTVNFSVLSAPSGVSLDPVSGVLIWTPTETQGPSTNLIIVQVIDNGVPALSNTNSFTVVVNEVNAAPVLAMPANQAIAEQTALNLNATATDPDVPANTLTFSLVSGPAGLAISSNGAITWTPSEAQGTSTNLVTVRVLDNGSPSLGATNSFQVIVTEVNNAPALPAVPNASINELTTLTITNTATDVDLPANTLSYQLLSGPANASISASGVITWTPMESQGPGTNVFTTKVTDNGTPALSATNSFTVVVNEANSAPALTVPANQTIAEQTALSVNATATDPDVPANSLAFGLVSGPAGVAVSSTGAITWTPGEAQGPSTNLVTVRVFDNGSPSLGATNSFQVIVTEVNNAPVLPAVPNASINELTTLTITSTATDVDLPANTLSYQLLSGPANAGISASGVITWTPTEAQGPGTNVFTTKVTDNGTPALSATNSFTVVVNEANSAPALTVPANQTIAEQTALSVNATATDPDVPANSLAFGLVSGPAGVAVSSTGAITWTPGEAQGPSTNLVTVRVFDNGSPSLSATNSFQVIVTEVNTAPILPAVANASINELTTLTITNTATDVDLPGNTLSYQLLSGPANASISASGVITWTPTEAQGPGTNVFTTKVTDNGTPALSATNSFTVVVNEVNSAPALTLPANQTIAEQTTLSVNATAMDSDVPTNTLTFSLVSGPAGLGVSSTGAITWTPSEVQGPSTNVATVRVFDNGSPSLSATNSFQVIVTEVNTAPALTVPADQTIKEVLDTLVVTNTATDSDLPLNTLTFGVVSAPPGAHLDPNTGVLTWTPSEAQGPSTNVIMVRVSDNGTPSLSATNSFTVIVNEVNSVPALATPANQTINELTTLVVTNTAGDADLPANTLRFSLVSGPEGVNLDATTGVLTWTPTEEQGPSTNVITVRVTDDGAPALSDTRSFTVVVNEVNNAPVLTPIPDQIVAAGNQLMIVNSATDSDVPKNILTFSLDSDAPPGAVIDPASGLLTWTPETNPGPGTNTVTVRVTDNGVPNLSDARPVNIIVVSRPVIESIVVLDDRVTLTWTAIPGRTYRVQFQTEPGQLIWSDLKGDVTAEGWDAAVSDLVLPTTQRFYRIALLP